MRWYVVLRYAGSVLLANSVILLCVFCYSLALGDGAQVVLLLSALLTALMGLFPVVLVPRESHITEREGYMVVVLSWLSVCFFGMMPYVLWGGPFDLAGAWFESVSGYTTTGATVVAQVEALPHSLLLWRALTHWVSGLGVVIFFLLVQPGGGHASMVLSRSELSSMARHDFRYRTMTHLRMMSVTYLVITLLIFLALLLAQLPAFDALTLAFATAATGGFCVRSTSVLAYNSLPVELILMAGMLICSIHLGLLSTAARGGVRQVLRNPILQGLLLIVGVVGLLVGLNLYFAGSCENLGMSFRQGFFMVISYVSTTGFATTNANLWPSTSLLLLLFLSFMGGCAGSTSGGLKVDRLLVLMAALRAYLVKLRHPQAVVMPHVGTSNINSNVLFSVFVFAVTYAAIVLLHTLFMSFFGYDLLTSFSVSASCMGNVGPALGAFGSLDSLAALPSVLKFSLSIVMLLGRLEIFGILLLFAQTRNW